MTDSMEIDAIGQIAIAISDMEKAVYFYQKILKLELLFEAPPGLAFFNCGGVRLMLTTLQGEEKDHQTSVLYYRLKQIEQVFEELKSLQVDIEQMPHQVATMEDHELWIGFVRDPSGNLVGLMEEKPLSDKSS